MRKRRTGKLGHRKSSKCLEGKRNPLRRKKDERKMIFPIWYYTFLSFIELQNNAINLCTVNVEPNFEHISNIPKFIYL